MMTTAEATTSTTATITSSSSSTTVANGSKGDYVPLVFQETAITRIVKAGSGDPPCGLILADEMGLGKTSQMCESIVRLIRIKDENAEAVGVPFKSTNAKGKTYRMTWEDNHLCYLILAPKSMISNWQKEAFFVNTELGKMTLICKEKLGNSRSVPMSHHRILITTPGLLRTAGWAHVQHQERNDLESFIDNEDQQNIKYADKPGDSSEVLKKKRRARAKIAGNRAKYQAKVAAPWFYKKVWDGVVLDEAHEPLANGIKCTGRGKFLENLKMKVARCIYFLKRERAWALTGTPIKNKISDLVALAKFVLADKNPFGYCEHWNTPAPGDKGDEDRIRMIQEFAVEFIIRRTDELLKLPPMKKIGVPCRMSAKQRQNAVNDMHTALGLLKELEKKKGVEKAKCNMALLSMIGRLRLNNSSPFLLKETSVDRAFASAKVAVKSKSKLNSSDDDDETSNVGEDEEDDSDDTANELAEDTADDSDGDATIKVAPWPKMDSKEILESSPKLVAACDRTRKVLQDGEQIIIFSFSVQTLKLLAKLLKDTVMPPDANGVTHEPPIFSGSTTGNDRDKMVMDFQSGKIKVLLLSSKAGGLGITLTAATNVGLLDPWWHPFVEFQAFKRAHRKGQDKEVKVFRFVMDGEESIDLWMLGLQKSKLEDAKILMPDLDRYSDCFILGSDKVNLVAEFKNWIMEWCKKYDEDIGKIVSSNSRKGVKAPKGARSSPSKPKRKSKPTTRDDDEYNPNDPEEFEPTDDELDTEDPDDDDTSHEDEGGKLSKRAKSSKSSKGGKAKKRKAVKASSSKKSQKGEKTPTRRSTRKAAEKKINYADPISDEDDSADCYTQGNVCWRCKKCSQINDQVSTHCVDCNSIHEEGATVPSPPAPVSVE